MKLTRNAQNDNSDRGKVFMTISANSRKLVEALSSSLNKVCNGWWERYDGGCIDGVDDEWNIDYFIPSGELKEFREDFKKVKAALK